MTNTDKDLSDPIADPVLGRMYNWKFRKAYENAKKTQGFPSDALIVLNSLAGMFEDCGWQDGTAFDLAKDNNNKVADILGYKWDDDADFWIKK